MTQGDRVGSGRTLRSRSMSPALPRRAALAGLAAAVSLIASRGFAQTACIATPPSTEGPFYFDPALERADIAEGRPGAPLELAIRVVDRDCLPLARARVEIWHADADGAYSGFGRGRGQPGPRETFMRGALPADASGRANFRTIWPGWYPGRTPHIHFKVRPDKGESRILTGQIYFPDEISEKIYRTVAPYAARPGGRIATNADDGLFRRSGALTSATVAERADGYLAALTVTLGDG